MKQKKKTQFRWNSKEAGDSLAFAFFRSYFFTVFASFLFYEKPVLLPNTNAAAADPAVVVAFVKSTTTNETTVFSTAHCSINNAVSPDCEPKQCGNDLRICKYVCTCTYEYFHALLHIVENCSLFAQSSSIQMWVFSRNVLNSVLHS